MKLDWPGEFPGAHYIDKQEERAVLDVLRKGSLFRYYGVGKPKYVDLLEETARKFYGAKYALALNSGTGALITAMSALGIGPGNEVILPAFLWVATVGAVVQANAIPVLCEVDDSFNMDPIDLEKKITPRTKLIVPIHMAGAPCDIKAIMAVANKHHVAVLEDCAQCNGGSFDGRKVGTYGAMGIFSLQLNKNMTSGEGGLVLTSDEQLFNKAFSAHDLGMVRVNGRLAQPAPGSLTWGGGRRMTELAGAVASVQIKKLPKIVAHMRKSKARIKALLKDTPGLAFRRLTDPNGDTGPFIIMILENEAQAQAAVARMKEGGLHSVFVVAGYGLHIYYNIPALVTKAPLSPAGNPWSLAANAESAQREYGQGQCPFSDALFARSVLVPVPSCLTAQQEKAAAEVIKKAVAG